MHLPPIQITAAKPSAKRYKLTDGDALNLPVQPTGKTFWRMNYRHLDRLVPFRPSASSGVGRRDVDDDSRGNTRRFPSFGG